MIVIQPQDPSRNHFYVSLTKSAIRIAAGISLIVMGLAVAGWLLIFAEVLGIAEELV